METQYCFYYFKRTYPLLRKRINFHGLKETKSIRFGRRRSLPIPISSKRYTAKKDFVSSCGLGGWVKGCGVWGIDITPTPQSPEVSSFPSQKNVTGSIFPFSESQSSQRIFVRDKRIYRSFKFSCLSYYQKYEIHHLQFLLTGNQLT